MCVWWPEKKYHCNTNYTHFRWGYYITPQHTFFGCKSVCLSVLESRVFMQLRTYQLIM